jgi:GNAT superfamily N-acetyltransferase
MPSAHNFKLRSDYWADANARAAFKDFIRQVFKFNIDPWDAAGYWDDDFRPFSLFADDGRIVASVCIYCMHMVVGGRATSVGQISSMGVLPELRRQGIGRQLSEVALRWASDQGHKFFMLFSSEEALPFYRSQGFTLTAEHTPVLRLVGETSFPINTSAAALGVRALDLTQPADRALLYRLASERCPVSQQLGVFNERLLMFRALLPPRGSTAQYIPSLDLAVLFRRREGVLTVYDIVGHRVPAFAELSPFLIAPSDREVVFWFMTDLLGDLASSGVLEHRPLAGNNLHLQASLPFSGPFIFPFSAQG